jgi:uncharacterized protein YjdB
MSRIPRALPGAALLLAALLASACAPKPAAIRLSESKLKVYGLGRVVSITGDVVDEKGEVVPGRTVEWSSSNAKVAKVDPATGAVTSVAPGRTIVTARIGDPPLEAAANVEVFDVALVNVVPSRTTLAGPAGSKFPLVIDVKDSLGAKVSIAARWESSSPKVATVDENGVVTSVGEGSATITAKAGDVPGASEVVVVFRTIDSLVVSPLTIPLKVGELSRVTLVAKDPQGAAIPDVAATWTTSDPKVATCSAGTVLGIGPGSATIRATCGDKTAEVSVIVF